MDPAPSEATIRDSVVYWATCLYIAYCDGDVEIASSATEPMQQIEGWLTEYARVAGCNVAYLPQWLQQRSQEQEGEHT